MKIGLMLPLADDETNGFADLRALALAAEEVGLDSVWGADHLIYREDGETTGIHECWTLLTAVAAMTQRVEIGPLVLALPWALTFYAGHGIRIQRVLSDNGGCYRSKLFAATAERLGVALRKTRPYRPQTNGKAERFIRTLLSEVGLRRSLPRHRRAGGQPADLRRLLQSISTALVTQRPAADEPGSRQQPEWELELGPPLLIPVHYVRKAGRPPRSPRTVERFAYFFLGIGFVFLMIRPSEPCSISRAP